MLPSTHTRDNSQFLTVSERPANQQLADADIAAKKAVFGPTMFEVPSTFHYNDRLRLSFVAREEFKADFVMIRGLIEFHRPKYLAFSYDRAHWTVTADLAADKLEDLRAFLTSVYAWLKKEKRFRSALRMAIEVENRHRLEAESVYRILMHSNEI